MLILIGQILREEMVFGDETFQLDSPLFYNPETEEEAQATREKAWVTRSDRYGNTYYCNLMTGEKTWDIPVEVELGKVTEVVEF